MRSYKNQILALLSASLLLLFPGCGDRGSAEGPDKVGSYESSFYANVFDNAEEIADGIKVDFSTLDEGYSGISIQNEKRIKVLLTCGDTVYVFNVPNDGSVAYIPYPCGNGRYTLQVMQNTVDNKYIELLSRDIDVTMEDEFSPFLHSNLLVQFDENSQCVKKAAELAAKADDDREFMASVYDFIKKTVVYDNELAETVASGYVPDPDRTLNTKKGICLDYAALAASMLRSQGVPTKVITGYVGEDALYHAWNAVYLKNSGWVAVELKISPRNWTRFDITFAAGGDIQSLYVDRFAY